MNQPQAVDTQLTGDRRFVEVVLNTVDSLIMVLDRNGRIVQFNHACEELSCYLFDEVKNRSVWDILIIPEEKKLVEASFANMSPDHFPNENVNNWVTKDGRRRLISWTNTVLTDTSGLVDYVIGVGSDITEREQNSLLENAKEGLQRVTTAMLQHLTTLDDVLAIVCTEALILTGATGSAVLLLEDEAWLQVKSSKGIPIPVLERMPIGESFAGLVLGERRPLLLNDPQNEMQAYHRNPDLRTLLAVPLYGDNTIIGALDVVNKPTGFTEEDIQVLQLFASQAAIAIEHAQLHQQAEKLAVIEERQRLARELHDSVTQALYSVTLYADATRLALSNGKKDVATKHLHELRNMAREAILDMRLLIFELHPPILEKEGLVTAIQTRIETVETRSGLRTMLLVEGEEIRLPLPIEEELYRITQEALNNAIKHAKAQQVTITIQYEDRLFILEVRDDGSGFDISTARQSGGVGLRGIEERVQRIGGQLIIESNSERGTALKVEVRL